MSNEEVLELNNNAIHKYINLKGYDIYEEKELYQTESGRAKTSDTQIVPNKTYWKVNTVNENGVIVSFESVLNPDISEIDTYYEEIYLRYPTSTKIDNNITYYTRDTITETYLKVDNPTSENISKYRIKIDNRDDAIASTKIGTLDSKVFGEIFNNYYFWGAHIEEGTKELYIIVTNGKDTLIYTSNGKLVSEFRGIDVIEISLYDKLLLAIKDNQGTFKIMDKDANIIFESKTLPLLHQIKYENNVYYLANYIGYGDVEFYNMYKSKIVNDSNSNINNGNSNNNITTETNQNLGEKDKTSKTGNNISDNKLLFVGLFIVSVLAALTTTKIRKNSK